jgi:double-stranded uracil-DNA glycosylase
MNRHASFSPVVDARTHTLILGSLPGAASLAARRYYANPRNQFWRLLGAVIGIPLHDYGYEARLTALLERGFGLWDVIAAAERKGSLDAAIRAAVAHDLIGLARALPFLHTIAFNGGTAARIGTARLGAAADRYRLLRLPSSSPAHAVSFQHKLDAWRQLDPQKSTNDSAEPFNVM